MDPMQLLLKHFEKGVLGGFVVWLVISAVGMLGGGQSDKGVDVAAAKAAIDTYMSKPHMEDPKKPDWVEALRSRLAESPSARSQPSWVFHRRPGFLWDVKKGPEGPEPEHNPPINLAGDTETRGQITLSWRYGSNQFVVVTAEVWRREGESGDWRKLADLKDGETEMVDRDISSLSTYYYKVVSVARIDTDEAAVQRLGLSLDPAEERKESDVLGPVGTKREVYIIPTNVAPVTDEQLVQNRDAVSTGDFKIYKWVDGAWVEGQFFRVKAGEGIGGVKNIRVGGKSLKVDFSTGATLASVRVAKMASERIQGFEEDVYFATLRWADGKTEEVSSRDKPPE